MIFMTANFSGLNKNFLLICSTAAPFEENGPYDMLSSKKLGDRELSSTMQPSTGGLNAVPMTAQEKSDCKKVLSPQELYQVVIGELDLLIYS